MDDVKVIKKTDGVVTFGVKYQGCEKEEIVELTGKHALFFQSKDFERILHELIILDEDYKDCYKKLSNNMLHLENVYQENNPVFFNEKVSFIENSITQMKDIYKTLTALRAAHFYMKNKYNLSESNYDF